MGYNQTILRLNRTDTLKNVPKPEHTQKESAAMPAKIQIITNEHQEELKEHGTYEFPVLVSDEALSRFYTCLLYTSSRVPLFCFSRMVSTSSRFLLVDVSITMYCPVE